MSLPLPKYKAPAVNGSNATGLKELPAATGAQVSPASALRNSPKPLDAKITLGSDGSTQTLRTLMAPSACAGMPLLIAVHVSPPSTLFCTPTVNVPANRVVEM